jgi:hypothetical protein
MCLCENKKGFHVYLAYQMKIAINIIVLSMISVTLLCHCERCVMEELPAQKFSDEELSMVPYEKEDTLTFLCKETNKTVAYRVIDKTSDFVKYSRGNPHDKYSSYCTGDFYFSQYWKISFDNKHCSLGLDISNSFEANNQGKTLRISFYIPDDSITLKFYGIYKIGPDSIMNGPNLVSEYHDSLTLNGSHFTHVYELLGNPTIFGQESDFLKTAFYTQNQGLVGFQTRKGNTWSLK